MSVSSKALANVSVAMNQEILAALNTAIKKAEKAAECAGQKTLYLIICLIFLVALVVMLVNSMI